MPITRTRRLRSTGVLAVVLAFGALATFVVRTLSHSPEDIITTSPAKRGDLEVTVTATGKIQPRAYVDVGAQASGQLRRILVRPGDLVEAGALLAEIDPQ